MRTTVPALTLLAALAACNNDSAPRPAPGPGPGPTTVQVGQPAPPPSQPQGHGARVVVDVSESIRGFASPRSVALETLHAQVIDGALSALGLNAPFERCTLDSDLHCGQPFVTPQQLRLPATYRGANAALHLALRRPPRAPRADLQLPDPLDPFAVTVLVTDGFQSSPTAFQANASEDVACTAGADPSCLAATLRRRVDEGYGVWVVRLQMPFDGRYFAERHLDDAMWQRVGAHVNALNTAPEWNGVRFTASSPAMNGESGAFRWTGARPLLMFVLSRNIVAGRALVVEMQRRINVERFTIRRAAVDVAASEWAPFEGLSARMLSAERAQSGGAADELRVDAAQRTPASLVVPVRCNIRGKSMIRLTGALSYGPITPPPFARIELGWRLTSRAAPEFLVPREPMRVAPGNFVVNTGEDCTVIPVGDYAYELGLHARWTVDPNALAGEWYMRESSDTSFEMPERMYGLGDLARAVVTAGVSREGFLDRVTVRVHRE